MNEKKNHLADLIDRAYELARSAGMDHEQTLQLRVLVAEAWEQGRVDRNNELDDIARLYRATLAYAEATGGPDALDELTGFTATERASLREHDHAHDGAWETDGSCRICEPEPDL
jgi:hypothetical protein